MTGAWVIELVTLSQHSAPSQHISTRHHQNAQLSSHIGSPLPRKHSLRRLPILWMEKLRFKVCHELAQREWLGQWALETQL